MTGLRVQDRFSRGLGIAAKALGAPHDLFRPAGPDVPLDGERLRLRLWAAFDLGNPGYRRPRGYERALRGTFDGDATVVGDYLRGPRGVLFVAMLPPLQRPLCVMTNEVFDVLRPHGAESPGLNGYGGVREARLRTVLSGWPGQILNAGLGPGALPDDGGLSGWAVLLPVLPVPILGSDLVRDRAGRRFLVRSAERTELGWRLLTRQVGV